MTDKYLFRINLGTESYFATMTSALNIHNLYQIQFRPFSNFREHITPRISGASFAGVRLHAFVINLSHVLCRATI
jgi:hypothetical protein